MAKKDKAGEGPLDCPKCVGRLESVKIPDAGTGSIADRDNFLEIDQCFACRGIWFDQNELKRCIMLEGFPEGLAPSIKDPAGFLDARDAKCPVCSEKMIKAAFPIENFITLDKCPKCKGAWLDGTEVDRLAQASANRRFFFAGLLNFLHSQRYG